MKKKPSFGYKLVLILIFILLTIALFLIHDFGDYYTYSRDDFQIPRYSYQDISIIALIFIFTLIITITIVIHKYKLDLAKIQKEKEKAEAENEAKSDFLSRMSHEIRTSMNAIIGLADLTSRMDNLPGNVRENIEKLKSSSYYLLNLLNDILDMSKINSGRVDLEEKVFSVNKIVKDVSAMLDDVAMNKDISFVKNINVNNDSLKGDETRLKQIIMNLLSNALKFTEKKGKVILTIDELQNDNKKIKLYISVEDTGIGIAEEDQERIFESFEQSSNYAKSVSKGTGLGLAICKKFVELMGGTLSVDSELGKGSKFYFTVEFDVGAEEPCSEIVKTVEVLKNINVLLVEDNDINADITTDMLNLKGATVTRVCDGLEAVECFKSSKIYEYDVILMDIQMPVLNGIEAAKRIRKLDKKDSKTVKIIALTANSFVDDIEKALAAGMNDFISKPMNMNTMINTILKYR